VQFVAANRGEGTSTVARDFAMIAAQRAHERVLLMDLGIPLNAQLGWATERGRLVGPADIPPIEMGLPVDHRDDQQDLSTWLRFHRLRNSSLFLSERYDIAQSQAEGAGPKGMSEFWNNMRAQFELVVVDTLAVSESFDPIMLSNQMDAVVLVVSAESTRAPVAQNVRDRIAEVGGPIIGVVLNRRRFHIPNFLYRRL
jgi:Mrp family chromosome partitioning ATPase